MINMVEKYVILLDSHIKLSMGKFKTLKEAMKKLLGIKTNGKYLGYDIVKIINSYNEITISQVMSYNEII